MKEIEKNNTLTDLVAKPSVSVDAVIFRIISVKNKNYRKLPEKKLQVFLTNRNHEPFINKYSVIGSFIDLQNELNESLKICVKNKVDLQNYYYEQLFTFGEKARDPRTRVISVSYLLLTNAEQTLKNGEWFDVDFEDENEVVSLNENGYDLNKQVKITIRNSNTTLNSTLDIKTKKENFEEKTEINIVNTSLAFDHAKIIYYAYQRLKNKLEYTDIIFNMINNEFTLTELKQCYELILKEKQLDANFRRKISKMVIPIQKLEKATGHRTSQLFTHNPNWHKLSL